MFERKVNGILGWNEYGNKDYHAKYEGEIENGQPNGQGKWSLQNGNKYEGEWKEGKSHGQGTLTQKNGKYVGGFKYGVWNGQGTYTWSNGNKGVGEYRNGKDWNTTGYDKHGNILGKYVNGEWIEQ